MATHLTAQSPYVHGRKDESSTSDTPLDSKAPTLLEEKGTTPPLPRLPVTDGKDEEGVDNNTPKSATATLSDEKGTAPPIANKNGSGKRNTTLESAVNSFPHKEDTSDIVKDTALEDDIVYPSGIALAFIVIALVLTIFLVRSHCISSVRFDLLTVMAGFVRYDYCCDCHSQNHGRISWN
jgi:hypothetical protein